MESASSDRRRRMGENGVLDTPGGGFAIGGGFGSVGLGVGGGFSGVSDGSDVEERAIELVLGPDTDMDQVKVRDGHLGDNISLCGSYT